MPFPQVRRAIFRKNPLAQVICQLRFPTILRIDTELPVAFQEAIRKEYPILNEPQEPQIPQAPKGLENLPLPAEIAQLFAKTLQPQPQQKRSYEFVSSDEQWTVGLNSSSISLSTTNYRRWEEFKEKFQTPFNSLKDIYEPAFFSRTGLRYINIIRKPDLDMPESTPWLELLQPQITGPLGTSGISEDVREFAGRMLIELEDNIGKVRTRFGLGEDQEGKLGYLIDNDFFTEERVNVKEAFKRLDSFNHQSGKLFQWVITTRLLNALQPEFID